MDNNKNIFSSNEGFNLTDFYEIEDSKDSSNQSLEKLAGYNLNDSEMSNETNNNARINLKTTKRIVKQNSSDNTQEELSRQYLQMSEQAPLPQRQEQTMPITRSENNEFWGNIGNLENLNMYVDMNDFLRSQIDKDVSIQFLIGNNALTEKSGKLVAVGDDFVALRQSNSGEFLACNFNDIKFIKFDNN